MYQEEIKPTEDRIKLFLLHSLLLNKLPLKYRSHTINNSLLDRFCKEKDGQVYPFQEVGESYRRANINIRSMQVQCDSPEVDLDLRLGQV